MKSAYEIAMERMRQESGETRSLSKDQKRRIARIDEAARAKIAEVRLGFDARIATASPEDRAELERELAADIARFENQAEREKEAIWNEAG